MIPVHWLAVVTVLTARAGDVGGPTEELVARGDGLVEQVDSGLIWQRSDNGRDVTWAEASEQCARMAGGGNDGWRLPSLDELEALHSTGTVGKFEIAPEFELSAAGVWSCNTRDDTRAWGFSFWDGRRFSASRRDTINMRALCVHDAALGRQSPCSEQPAARDSCFRLIRCTDGSPIVAAEVLAIGKDGSETALGLTERSGTLCVPKEQLVAIDPQLILFCEAGSYCAARRSMGGGFEEEEDRYIIELAPPQIYD